MGEKDHDHSSSSEMHKHEQRIDPIPTISDIVKFTEMGFTINSSKMQKNYPYHFEHDGNIYEIRLDGDGRLKMRLMD